MATLSIIVECSACSWGKMATEHGEASIGLVIRSVVSFANSYLSMSSGNKVLLFGYANEIKSRLLFNSRRSPTADHSLAMTKALRNTLLENASSSDSAVCSPLARVLSHAICHMKRNEDVAASGADQPSGSSTSQFINGRVVILSMTCDFGPEHGALMNLFFSAAKHGICVDVVSLGESSPLLQQAADITSGLFVSVPGPKQLLKQLMLHVLAEPSTRSLFPQPMLQSVDYRASCACHHKLVSSGFVCSVCLSVLCAWMPICKACGAVFKLPPIPRKNLKRKRKE